MQKIISFIFFGNYFYGLCAIALSIEASLQQHVPLNNFVFYLLIFLSTIVYYTKAYLQSITVTGVANLRSEWYKKYQIFTRITQIIFSAIIILLVSVCFYNFKQSLLHLHLFEIFLIILFPLTGLLYYGLENSKFAYLKLRQIGWLKPFIIGFCWAGVVTIYPLVYYQISHTLHFEITFICCLLFVKNFMFVSVLSIMFDIKDYASDFNQELKTFVVKYGLRKTIFYIIIPLTLFGLLSFLTYATIQHFGLIKICLNLVPFILVLTVANSLQKRKSIFYYLAIIDGLMLLKGLCGSLAMTFFSF